MSKWVACIGLAFALSAFAQISPYVAEQHSDIKALSADEQAALRAGKGMGFARAAELNGYPGPLHVLELAEPLKLSDAQLAGTNELFARMQRAAQTEGAALIDAERELDTLFATKAATTERVEAQLSRIEAIRARLRAVHLDAHLEQAKLLTSPQIARYGELRGYDSQRHHGH